MLLISSASFLIMTTVFSELSLDSSLATDWVTDTVVDSLELTRELLVSSLLWIRVTPFSAPLLISASPRVTFDTWGFSVTVTLVTLFSVEVSRLVLPTVLSFSRSSGSSGVRICPFPLLCCPFSVFLEKIKNVNGMFCCGYD